MKTYSLRLVVYIFLAILGGLVQVHAMKNTNDFEMLMEKIRTDFVKNPSINEYLKLYDETNGSFIDIDYSSTERTNWEPMNHINRVSDFVFAYTHPDHPDYQSESLYNKIKDGLNYWYNRNPDCDNWWYNQIDEPQKIGVLLIQMRIGKKLLPEELETKTLRRMREDGGDPRQTTGANMTDIALHWIYRACLEEDKKSLDIALDCVNEPVQYTVGEGFQYDNCYLLHGPQLYIGGYGDEILKGVTQVAMYTQGTKYELDAGKIELLSKFMRETYYQTIRGKYMLFDVLGRSVSRPGTTNKSGTVLFAKRMLVLDPAHTDEYNTIIERLEGKKTASYGLTPLHTHYFNGDYTLHVRPKYTFDVRLVSDRTSRCEHGNGENLKTYFLSDGCTNIVMNGDEYYDIYPVWNWMRIPGTTAPQMSQIPKAKEWQVLGTSEFAGGVSDSIYGVTAYAYEDNYSGVNTGAKKAWFFFDDEIVCLGADITSKGSFPVNTTINQCLLGNLKVSLKGEVQNVEENKEVFYKDELDWVLHNRIGYVFPKGGNIFLSNKSQEGSWYDINTTATNAQINKKVFTLGFNHDYFPQKQKYAYVIVPSVANGTKMKEYLEKNSIEILANSDSMQVVRHKGEDVWEMVFYRGATFVHDNIRVKVDRGCTLLFKDIANTSVKFHIADPAQSQSIIKLGIQIPTVSSKMKEVHCDFTGMGAYAGMSKVYSIDEYTPDYGATGLKEVENQSLSALIAYPNPAKIGEPVMLEFLCNSQSDKKELVHFYSLMGAKVKSEWMEQNKATVSFENRGVYIGQVGSDNVQGVKIVVE